MNYELKTVLPTIVWNGGDATGSLFIRLRDGRLSITGEVREKGRGITHAGQCIDTIAGMYPDNDLVKRITEMWKRWHLNDMRAGCEHQRDEKWEERPVDPNRPLESYIESNGYRGWNRLTWKPEKDGGLLGAPCPKCGYRFGTKWLFEKLPQDVLDTLDDWRYHTSTFSVEEIAA